MAFTQPNDTVKSLFTHGDGAVACSHKFSSGSHAKGRIAAKGAIAYIVDDNQAATQNAMQAIGCF